MLPASISAHVVKHMRSEQAERRCQQMPSVEVPVQREPAECHCRCVYIVCPCPAPQAQLSGTFRSRCGAVRSCRWSSRAPNALVTPLTESSPINTMQLFTTVQHLPVGKPRARHGGDAGCWARFGNIDLQPGARRPLFRWPLLCNHCSALSLPSCPVLVQVVCNITQSHIPRKHASPSYICQPRYSRSGTFCCLQTGMCLKKSLDELIRLSYYDDPASRPPLIMLGGGSTTMLNSDVNKMMHTLSATCSVNISEPRPVCRHKHQFQAEC